MFGRTVILARVFVLRSQRGSRHSDGFADFGASMAWWATGTDGARPLIGSLRLDDNRNSIVDPSGARMVFGRGRSNPAQFHQGQPQPGSRLILRGTRAGGRAGTSQRPDDGPLHRGWRTC
jgi:hypothetical protein